MMQRSLWGLAVLLGCVSGCGWGDGEPEPEPDNELAEMTLGAEPLPSATPESLELRLKKGDRFPLQKTVQQTLYQSTPQGLLTSRSTLELLLAITVEETENNRTRLGVQYQHVRYQHDVAGRRIEYDSHSPPHPIPVEVQAYHGMVNNGFSFWIGPANRIIELVDFEGFLERCVRDVPPAQRPAVLAHLAATSGDEGIANFIDDSIGLLPSRVGEQGGNSVLKVGDTWTRNRQLVQPIPMYLSTKCTLKALDDHVAQIEILGNISPSTTYGPPNQNHQNMRLTVRGGHSVGHCTIDRKTGLPIDSKVERFLDMLVQSSDGVQYEQRKHIVTTIRTFPAQGEVRTAADQRIVPSAAARSAMQNSPPNRISNATQGSDRR